MIRKTLILLAAVAVVGACDSTEPRVPTAVEVNPTSLALESGDVVTATAVVLDQRGRAYDTPPQGFALTWTSTNQNVVTVNGGTITAVGSGQALVRVTAGSLPPAEIQVAVVARTLTAQLGFSYSGAQTGTFSVQSTFTTDEIGLGNWAVTFYAVDDGEPFTDAMAERVRTDGLVDFVWFWVEGHINTPGTRAAGALLFTGWDLDLDTVQNQYRATAGTAVHTSVTSSRMAGTFVFTMEDVQSGAALDVTAGTFDLPLVTEVEVFGDASGPGEVAALGSRTALRAELLHRLRATHR
jgi:hypothetical protein